MSVAVFERVSEKQYLSSLGEKKDALLIGEIPLPHRSTAGSAGYDFVTPVRVEIPAGGTAFIPTGIRCRMEAGWVLMIFPRSSLGFRHQVRLSNTVGIIDGDYYYADNEGHIQVPLRNPTDHAIALEKGERFCQGVLVPFGLAEEAETPPEARKGGFGSTGR